MLTSEVIKANEKLAGLSDEQIAAITTLSQNDENDVIGRKTGEFWGSIDKDVKEILGIEKPAGAKTYDWLKTDVYGKAKAAKELEGTINNQKAKIAELEEAIKKNAGDETLKQKLKDMEDKLKASEEARNSDTETWKKKYEDKSAEVTSLKVNQEFNKGLTGLKFKDEKLIPASIRNIAINQAKQAVLALYEPDMIDAEDGSGKQVMVWRKKGTNEIARNKANGLNPYTASELLLEQEAMKEIVDAGKVVSGGGGGAGGKENEDLPIVDISQAKTQVQADELIRKQLMEQGFAGKKLDDEHQKVRKEAEVAKLPMR